MRRRAKGERVNMDYSPAACTERRRRIALSIAAYTYEYLDRSVMTDADYDKLSLMIDPQVSTGHPVMDKFFREQFNPSTGMWIRNHPELAGIEYLARRAVAEQWSIVP